jgi:ATP-dependent DNA helicase RecG
VGLIRRTATTVDQRDRGPGPDLRRHASTLTSRPAAWVSRGRSAPGTSTGFLTLTWFKGHGPHLERQHPAGERRAVSGKVERLRSEIQVAHPDYLLAEERAGRDPRVEPVYPATAGLPSRTFRKFALEALERAAELPEWQDPPGASAKSWPGWREALAAAHNPAGEADLSPAGPATPSPGL